MPHIWAFTQVIRDSAVFAKINTDETILFINQQKVREEPVQKGISSTAMQYYFRAGSSRAGDRLLSMEDPVIEEIFNDLKPAHTLCIFNYS